MQFAAAVSTAGTTATAVAEIGASLREQLGNQSPDLTVLISSVHHRTALPHLPAQLRAEWSTQHLLGSTAETVICGERELEGLPALAAWSAVLPGCELVPLQVEFRNTPDGVFCVGLPENLNRFGSDVRAVLMFADPATTSARSLLAALADEFPGVPVIGGMASGGNGDDLLLIDERAVATGAVGMVLVGGPHVSTVVSQGCRPIASPFVVTRAEQNLVFELGGHPPLRQLEQLFVNLPTRDQRLIEQGLQLGIATSEYRDTFSPGDFLVSSVIGLDRETGAMAVGNRVRAGQTVQFHVRDSAAADEDLQRLLARYQGQPTGVARAALLFSCNGRGTRLFPEPHHDARLLGGVLPGIPVIGMFAAGEFGPVGGQNYVHGFTASVAIFEAAAE